MIYQALRGQIEEAGVHALLGPTGQGWGIEQNPHELAAFLSSLPPIASVLEIGTGYRAGLARFMSECLGWHVTTIDRWLPDTPAPLARQIVGMSQDVIAAVSGHYDLVIIDGDHAYHAAKGDYLAYGGMGQIVMFHDIAGLRDCEGAAQLWQELSRDETGAMKAGYYEVIDNSNQRAGIGWIVQ